MPANKAYVLALAGLLLASSPNGASAKPLIRFDTQEDELKDAEDGLRDLEKKIRDGAIPPIQFEFDKAVLKPESKRALEAIAELLLSHPRIKLAVFGHTCDIGSVEYNQWLSQKRAEAVKTYLTKLGVLGEGIRAKGFGKSRPLVPNDSEENRALNRRVEFRLVTRWWASIY